MSVNRVPKCEFRSRRSYLILGVTYAIGFGAVGSAFVFAAAANINRSVRYPIPTAVFFGVFWGAWFIASLWVIAAYFREQFTIESEAITQQGVLRRRTASIAEISKLQWQVTRVCSSAVIHYAAGRMKVYFENFTANERTLLIERLRQLVPEQHQENWDAFNEGLQRRNQGPQKSRSTGIVCLLAFFTTGVAFIFFWYNHVGSSFLLAGAANIVASVWYLIRVFKFVP